MLLTYTKKKKTRKVKGAIRRLAAYVPALLKKKKKKSDCEYEGSLVSDFKGLLVDCSFPFWGHLVSFFFFSYYYLLVLKKNDPFFFLLFFFVVCRPVFFSSSSFFLSLLSNTIHVLLLSVIIVSSFPSLHMVLVLCGCKSSSFHCLSSSSVLVVVLVPRLTGFICAGSLQKRIYISAYVYMS